MGKASDELIKQVKDKDLLKCYAILNRFEETIYKYFSFDETNREIILQSILHGWFDEEDRKLAACFIRDVERSLNKEPKHGA